MSLCPCESGKSLENCCEPIISGEAAPTAVALMRSRYTAYVQQNAEYLRYSWHPQTRPGEIKFLARQKWLGLSIKRTQAGQEADSHGVVEFVARFKIDGRGHRMREVSRFERLDGRWTYVDAE